MTDQYQFWRRALAGHVDKRNMNPGNPQTGFWRLREYNGVDSSVAYWIDDAELRCQLNGKLMTKERALELWEHVCNRPVSHQDYQYRIANGRWRNEVEVLAKAPAAGHNKPPADNTHEALTSVLDAIENEAKKLLEAGPAKSQDEVDHASDIANELGALEKRVIDAHRVEKAPVLLESKRIDSRWANLRDKAADLKTKLKLRVVTPFLAKLRREQEEAKVAAIAQGVPAAEVPTEKIKAGSLRRSSALKIVKTARIEHYPDTLAYFSTHKEVMELIQKLADRAVRAGASVPGTVVVETEQAV